jgi:hypothetical protein
MSAAVQTITHLSFTRLKNLAHSPLKLKNYIEQVTPATDAMIEGSLFDCLLFEPEKFGERFFSIDKPDRRTKDGKAAYEAALEQCNGRTLVYTEQIEAAKSLITSIEENSTVVYHGLLNPDFFKFQVEVKFFLNGFLHKGVKDADGTSRSGERVIWDLKRMGNASGEKLVRSQIRANKYDLQAAIYCHEFDSKNEPVKYYVIAVDNDGYVTPFEIGRDAREQARIEWMNLIRAAHRCNMEGLDMGPEFWAGHDGFFQY